MKRAIRWVPERSEYRDWRVPDGASVCADDFSTVVDCAECGCELAFGESYTSRLIHNDLDGLRRVSEVLRGRVQGDGREL